MRTGRKMQIGKTAEAKAGKRSDRTVFAERRNRLERIRNDFQMKLLDRERARTRFVIGKERKEIAKSFQSVHQTTGQSELGIPSSLHDKDVCSSEHYRMGVVISNRRLKQWRRQEELLQKHVTKEEVKDEEEVSDRQIVLNNLLAEIRHEYDDVNEMTRPRSRAVKELRMPYAAHPSTLDVFENLRTEKEKLEIERPATAPVQRIRHRGDTSLVDSEPSIPKKSKHTFDIQQWEKRTTIHYIDSSIGKEKDNLVGLYNNFSRPYSAQVPLQSPKVCLEPKMTNGQMETPLFIRVNKHLSAERGILKIRPQSASLTDDGKRGRQGQERPKSSSHTQKGKGPLKSNSTTAMTTASLDLTNQNKPLTPPLTSSKSSVAFDLTPTVHDAYADDMQITNCDESEDPDGQGERLRKSATAIVPEAFELSDLVENLNSETVQNIVDIPTADTIDETPQNDTVIRDIGPSVLPEERPSTAERSSRKTSSTLRKVSFHDSYRPIQRLPRNVQQDRDRKISSSSTGSGSVARESIDILRKKHLLINLDARGSLNKRLTSANRSESSGNLSGEEEETRPSGPAQWRRELLRDAPPGVYSQAEKPKVHMTMSRSARRKELEKMVESNTSNLRDMIISEKERRAQTRINLQKSMAELDSIN